MNRFYCLFPLVILCATPALAKSSLIKDEDQIKAYLMQKDTRLDTSANAVYLNEYCKVIASFSERKLFYEFKVEKVAKVLNEAGKDIAEVKIDLKPNQQIENVETITYNLAGKNTVKEKISSKPYTIVKRGDQSTAILHFDKVSEGTVIYYSYTLRASDDFILPKWMVQERYPKMHAKMEVATEIGSAFAVYDNKNISFTHERSDDLDDCSACNFAEGTNTDQLQFKVGVWSRNNVPAIKTQFSSHPIESGETVTIQLLGLNNLKYQHHGNGSVYGTNDRMTGYLNDMVLNTWEQVNRKMLKGNPHFEMKPEAELFNKKLSTLTGDNDNELIKAKAVFAFVRDSITLENSAESIFYNRDINEVLKNKKGNRTEKNLLLVTMLRTAKLNADPVVFIKDDDQPLAPDFLNYASLNYCVASFLDDKGTRHFLDASETGIPFGTLLPGCYDKNALLVTKALNFISLPTAPKEQVTALVNIDKAESGNDLAVFINIKLSKLWSVNLRDYIASKGTKKETGDLKKVIAGYLQLKLDTASLNDYKIENLYNVDSLITLEFHGKMKPADIFNSNGFNPFILNTDIWKEKDSYSKVPYELVYIFNMYVPAEYTIRKLPESKKIALADNAITYTSVVKYDASEKSLKLTYKYKDNNKNLDQFKNQDLNSFFRTIEKNQSEEVF
jgi:hypothetical protein